MNIFDIAETSSDEVKPTADSEQIYMRRLREFSKDTFLEHENRSTVVERAINFIADVLPISYVIVGEVIKDAEEISIIGTYGLPPETENVFGQRAIIMSLLCRDIISFTESNETDREMASNLIGGYPVVSGISVPISIVGGNSGVLAVYSETDREFNDSKIAFLNAMANVISISLMKPNMHPIVAQHTQNIFQAKKDWESTIDVMPQLVIVLDKHANVVRVNRTIDSWGLGTVNSHLGRSVEEVIKPLVTGVTKNYKIDWAHIWKGLQKDSSLEWESSPGSNNKSLRFSLRRLLENEKKFNTRNCFAVLVVDDITEHKTAEQALKKYTNELEKKIRQRTSQLRLANNELRRELEDHTLNKTALVESEERYNLLLQSSLAGICTIKNGKIDYCNDRFAYIFDYRKTHLIDRSLEDFIFPEDMDSLNTFIENILNIAPMQQPVVVKGVRRNGEHVWIEIKLNLINLVSEQTLLVNVIDITEQKNTELTLRDSESRLHVLSSQLINAQENERKRLAYELHDGIGQWLSAIKFKIENVIDTQKTSLDSNGIDELNDVIGTIRETIEETRRISSDLRPSMLDDLGILTTINWFIRKFENTYKTISVNKLINLDEDDITDYRKVVIYRVMQESMNNIAKHANANVIEITLEKDNANIYFTIVDNGCGFDLDKTSELNQNDGFGTGLNSMRERAELTGGDFSLLSKNPGGTSIKIVWPR
ncbi:MAG: PAS domain S-box protein [Thiohalomonadales bacterium]